MRIKSYFAPSVQAAIALARKEFGDNVTLVTSHVAALDNRHLGEYEVVFAVEESIEESGNVPEQQAEQTEAAPAPVFSEMLQQAITAPLPMQQDLPEKLEQIHNSLVALGLDASVVRAFMTMLKAVMPAGSSVPDQIAAVSMTHDSSVGSVIADVPVIVLSIPEAEEPPVPEPPPSPPAQIELPKLEIPKPALRPFLSLFETARPQPRFSDAELAFMSSVSAPKEQGA